jgi:hypothetical protein
MSATTATATTATVTTSAAPVTTTTKAVPSISLKPNLKTAQTQNNYTLAMERLATDFQASYLNDTSSPDEVQTVKDSLEIVRSLCDKHLLPLFNERPATAMTGGAGVGSAGAAPASTGRAKGGRGGKLSDWQIYLKYCKDMVPGYSESTEKMHLATQFYQNMSTEDCAKLREKYYAEHPEAATAAVATSNNATKPTRSTGFSNFAKAWYAEFKAKNPGASGLQSGLCGAAWKALTPAEQQQWKDSAAANN